MSDVFVPSVDPNDEQHLTEGELQGLGPRDPDNELASTGVEIHCLHCGRTGVMQSKYSKTMCVDCYQAFASRNTAIKVMGDPQWKEHAKQQGIDLWEQLPGESNTDYRIFKAYMGLYPLERPTLKRAAEIAGCSYGTASVASRRGHFAERLDAWIHECDRATMLQRRNEMIDMNNHHIKMAQKLRRKLDTALDTIQPETLAPRDIVALAKLTKDMEREARVDTIAQEEMQAELAKVDDNKDLKKDPTKEGDLGEVLAVLLKSGALGDVQSIGLRATADKHGNKTQELVVQKPDRRGSASLAGINVEVVGNDQE